MKRYTFLVLSMLIVASMVLAACQPAATPAPTEAPPEATEAPQEPVATEAPPSGGPAATPKPPLMGGWLDEIVVSVVDSASAVTQIQAGAIDIYAAGLSSDALPEIEAAGLDYAQSNGLYYELTFNTYGPIFDQSTGKVNPFSDARAREAMNWLVDRDYINREVYNGGALAKFWSIITNMPDYTKMAETVRRLEAEYAYNPERAAAQMDEVMLAIEGVTKEDGKYMFNGEPVTLIMLIRTDSDGTRRPIGDYVANQLESIGFAVDRQYKTSSEASPIWVGGNVADGLWHIYTGAWSATIIDRDEGDNFEFFDTPQSAYGFSSTWQQFPTALGTPYGDLADKLSYNKFTSLEERDAALAQMLEMALKESIHVWLIDGKNFTPYRAGVEVTYDLAAGVDGSMIWPYTIRLADQEGGQLKWGTPDLFVDPWNPIAGSNWAFDQAIGRATWGEAYMIDPHTGLYWPQRFERAEVTVKEGLPVGKTLDWVTLDFAPEIVVPDDAIMDWDAGNQAFITSSEKFPIDAENAAADLEATKLAIDEGPTKIEAAQGLVDQAQASFDAIPVDPNADARALAQTALDEATAALEAAQAALAALPADATAEAKTAAQTAVDEATAALTQAQANFDAIPVDPNAEARSTAQVALDEATAALEQAQADLQEAEAHLPEAEQAVADFAKGYFTANVKSVVYYPEDLWDTVKFHDGSPIDLGDFVYSWILSLDMGKADSAIYDEAYAANAEAILNTFKGWKIVSENPLVIETYFDNYQTDAELNIRTFWPSYSYGESPWHVMAIGGLADAAGEVAFSADKADAKSTDTTTVEWLSFIGGPSLEVLGRYFDQGIADQFVPYANALGEFITPEEAVARYENAQAFFAEYGHYNIGSGPYILAEVALTEKVATLINNPNHPDKPGKWSQFGDPKVASIEVEGDGSVVLSGEFMFDVFVTFDGEAYPADEIKEVKGLLYDATNQIVQVLNGELVEDGHYTITVPADVAAAMEAGASKLEAVVVPYTVAIPSFSAFEFVTVK